MTKPADRYAGIAVALHWVMALAILLMLASGFVMAYGDLGQSLKFRLYQWHKSLGVLLLVSVAFRILLRLVLKAPALPGFMPAWEARAARAGHLALYLLMVAMPVTGWIVVSASVFGLPTIVFGLFEWPHVPGIAGDAAVESAAKGAHFWLAILIAATIAGHVAAVFKHIVIDRENILARMWWGRGRTLS